MGMCNCILNFAGSIPRILLIKLDHSNDGLASCCFMMFKGGHGFAETSWCHGLQLTPWCFQLLTSTSWPWFQSDYLYWYIIYLSVVNLFVCIFQCENMSSCICQFYVLVYIHIHIYIYVRTNQSLATVYTRKIKWLGTSRNLLWPLGTNHVPSSSMTHDVQTGSLMIRMKRTEPMIVVIRYLYNIWKWMLNKVHILTYLYYI